jgi:hypothetical protein
MSASKQTSPFKAADIAMLGNQVRALLDTLCHNLEDPGNSIFTGTVRGRAVDPRMMEFLLQRIETQGKQFLKQVDDQFKHPPRTLKARRSAAAYKLAVMAFAHREP